MPLNETETQARTIALHEGRLVAAKVRDTARAFDDAAKEAAGYIARQTSSVLPGVWRAAEEEGRTFNRARADAVAHALSTTASVTRVVDAVDSAPYFDTRRSDTYKPKALRSIG